jgi:hypothetical protein
MPSTLESQILRALDTLERQGATPTFADVRNAMTHDRQAEIEAQRAAHPGMLTHRLSHVLRKSATLNALADVVLVQPPCADMAAALRRLDNRGLIHFAALHADPEKTPCRLTEAGRTAIATVTSAPHEPAAPMAQTA